MLPRGSHVTLPQILAVVEELAERVGQLEVARKSDSAAMDQLHTDLEDLRGAMGGGMDAEMVERFDRFGERLDKMVESLGEPMDPTEAVSRKLDALILKLDDPPSVPPQTEQASPPWPWQAYVALAAIGLLAVAMLLGQLGQLGHAVGSLPVERVVQMGGDGG